MGKIKWADVVHMYTKSGIEFKSGWQLEMGVAPSDQKTEFSLPILRHLEDMTFEEKSVLARMLYCESIDEVDDRLRQQAYNAVRDQFGGPNLASWRIGFLVMAYLISKGFDVFGLIEAKEAIRKGVENG